MTLTETYSFIRGTDRLGPTPHRDVPAAPSPQYRRLAGRSQPAGASRSSARRDDWARGLRDPLGQPGESCPAIHRDCGTSIICGSPGGRPRRRSIAARMHLCQRPRMNRARLHFLGLVLLPACGDSSGATASATSSVVDTTTAGSSGTTSSGLPTTGGSSAARVRRWCYAADSAEPVPVCKSTPGLV